MAIQTMELDPNAQSYTDDQIVGKVNSATSNITRAGSIEGTAASALDSDDIGEGSSNFYAGASGADFVKASDDLDDITTGITNVHFVAATDEAKLDAIEANATTDQTGAEIKTAYEAETNAYTDTKDTKLTGIEEDATADQTGNEIVTAIDAGSSSITREDAVDASSMDLVKTNPTAGEYKVKAIHRGTDGKLQAEYDDVAV